MALDFDILLGVGFRHPPRRWTSTSSSPLDFNILLGVKYASMADIGPSREKYDAFMAAWGEANQDSSRETSKTYPELRKITGQYLMHELTMLDSSSE